MFCQKCGKVIPDESVYCMFCGTPTNSSVVASAKADPYPSNTMERFYEGSMKKVANQMKNPEACTWPRYTNSMLVDKGSKSLIETSIHATNSYNATLKIGIRIKMSDDANPRIKSISMKNPTSWTWTPLLGVK